MLRACIALFLLLEFSQVGQSQVYDFAKQREQVISLDGKWRFHTGDDPRWADPNFDDRGWSLLRSNRLWSQEGYVGYGGFAWYRFHVQSPPKESLGLMVVNFQGATQIFADGRTIGAVGKMPPHGTQYFTIRKLFAVPGNRSTSDLTIAIRVWHDPVYAKFYGGGPFSASLLGRAELVQNRERNQAKQLLGVLTVPLFVSILEVLAGLTALGLFVVSRSEHEFLWFALMQLFLAANRCLSEFSELFFSAVPLNSHSEVQEICSACAAISTVLFLSYVLRARRNWLAWTAIAASAIAPLLRLLSFYGLPSLGFEILSGSCRTLLLLAWTLWTLGRGLRQRLPDAHLLLVPILLNVVCQVGERLSNAFRILAKPVPWYFRLFESGLPSKLLVIRPGDIADFVFLLSVLAILIGRFTRTRRSEERYTRELEEARTVQQVLVPEEPPTVPGFSIASSY